MKVLTVLGTRPEIIRLSRVIEKLDGLCDHVLVHTGQNFDPKLSDLFFEELGVRPPDHHLGVSGATFGEQIGRLLTAVDAVLREERPEALLVLGDTNSGLCTVLAKRLGITVFHMEAGNRCYDDRVPEEVNRRVIDHSSSVLMPYTQRSKENLLREGVPGERIYVTGNPIHEVLEHYAPQIDAAPVFERLGVEPRRYFLATMHRAENVDVDERLRGLAAALEQAGREYDLPVLCSLHPRTQQKMRQFGVRVADERVRFLEPLGLFDFVALERQAFCTLSDSGTVQEECCLFHVPTVTMRDVTERPETVECGSNMLAGVEPETVLRCVRTVTASPPAWTPPPEYLAPDVSSAVVKIVLGRTPLERR
ncbi:MAG: UDP-N-acetylglucosamine 2-epimerase (non-hydrolyzing) [Thermoleophilia bacterium]